MRIAYCEDEPAQAGYIRAMIEEWAAGRHHDVQVVLFESAEEFLFKNDAYPYDAVFLDIALKKMDGMELAHAIRRKDKRIPIAFLTGDRGSALTGYEVRAVRYLLKPIGHDKLFALLDELWEETAQAAADCPCMMVEEKGILRKISEDSLCYIEVMGHYTQLYLADGSVVRVKESLGTVMDRIRQKELFVRCHRSYVVNLAYVERISRTDCVLCSEARLPVSRSAHHELNERFIRFYQDSMMHKG